MNVEKTASSFAGRRGRWLLLRFKAVRAFSLPVSVLPVFVASAAVCPIRRWDWTVTILSVAGVILMHVMGNLVNDYFDFKSGVDRRIAGDENRPGRYLVHGLLRGRDYLLLAGLCFVLLLPIAVFFIWRCGAWILPVGLAGVGLLYAYTGRPFQLKYHALGELVIFIVFGPMLMVGAGYAQTLEFSFPVLLLSIPVGLATTAVLVGNNIRDITEDSAARITTLASLLGERASGMIYIALASASVFALSVLAVLKFAPAAMVLAPLGLLSLINPTKSVLRRKRLADIDAQTARFVTIVLVYTFCIYTFAPRVW